MKINSTEIFSTCNEGKSVVAERFIRTLKIKIFKHVTTVSKNVYFDVLDDIINKYNNKVHKTMKMKLIYVTSDSYADYNQDSNKKILNLKLVIMAEHKKTKNFLLWDTPKIQQKKFLSFAKLKILTWSFYERDLQNTSQENVKVEKIIKIKGDKWYVKWKGYESSFNSWFDKKIEWNSLV